MAPPIRKTKFIPEWIDMTPKIPVPRIDWIKNKQLEIAYGNDPLQRYDLYYPPNEGPEPYPVVIIVHGGGFSHMDKRDWHMYPGFFALQEGFALISVNYRLAPETKHSGQVDDLTAAILHIKAHAAEWKLDSERLFLYGTSAGGNLVSIVGLKAYNQNAPYAVRAIAALCPLLSFTWIWEERHKRGASLFLRIMFPYMCHNVFGVGPAKAVPVMEQASAENYIQKTVPAFYLQTGTQDPAIDYRHIIRFHERLAAAENTGPDRLVLDLLEGAPHAGAGPDYLEPPSIMPILEFFKKQCPIKANKLVSK